MEMCVQLPGCLCVGVYKKMLKKVPESYQTNSFSPWPGFNNAEFVPENSSSSSTSLGLIQSVMFWLKQALSGNVHHRPATDPLNLRSEEK